jgi:CRISPR/Cas system-associated exonuclease Cas4 (RecB family)
VWQVVLLVFLASFNLFIYLLKKKVQEEEKKQSFISKSIFFFLRIMYKSHEIKKRRQKEATKGIKMQTNFLVSKTLSYVFSLFFF